MLYSVIIHRVVVVRRGCISLSALLFVIFAATAVIPEYHYGELSVSLADKGVVVVGYLAFSFQGQILTWGYPGWQWDPYCSMQSEWVMEIRNDVISGHANCSYGFFLWSIKAWPASDCVIVEATLEAQTDIMFDDIAWVLYLPAEQFAGYSATALRTDGTTQTVTFRVEQVPGQAGLGPGATGAGWVVPFGEGVGVATTIFTDAPTAPYLDITDDRVWGGTTYSVRQILFPGMDNLMLKAGSSFTFYVYIHPYNNLRELEVARQRLLNIFFLLGQGVKASEIRDYIASGRLEEFMSQLQAEQFKLRFTYVAAAALVVSVAVAATLRLRKKIRT